MTAKVNQWKFVGTFAELFFFCENPIQLWCWKEIRLLFPAGFRLAEKESKVKGPPLLKSVWYFILNFKDNEFNCWIKNVLRCDFGYTFFLVILTLSPSEFPLDYWTWNYHLQFSLNLIEPVHFLQEQLKPPSTNHLWENSCHSLQILVSFHTTNVVCIARNLHPLLHLCSTYILFYVESWIENKIAKRGLVITILTLQEVLKPVATKGQIISECPYEIIVVPK